MMYDSYKKYLLHEYYSQFMVLHDVSNNMKFNIANSSKNILPIKSNIIKQKSYHKLMVLICNYNITITYHDVNP